MYTAEKTRLSANIFVVSESRILSDTHDCFWSKETNKLW
jgi:hypothetical protein